MSNALDVFQAHSAGYEDDRRGLIPCFDAFYGTAIEALGHAGRPLHRVLDLGAGTGLVSRRVLAAFPGASLTLVDGAPGMLDQAREALGARAEYVVGDLRDPLPAGPWDAVVSALAIHHLADGEKQELFARVHEALAPGGLFVNAEQVAAPTAFLDDVYRAWHARRARELGVTDAGWAASQERMRLDRWATVERQLAWLRAAGFADADCLFKDHGFAVLVARRAG